MQHLAEWRRERGWTQEDLARLVEVAVSTIKRWEHGDTYPYPLHLERLHQLGFGQTETTSAEWILSPHAGNGKSRENKCMSTAEEPRREHPSTYFVQDRQNQEELDRLTIQDRMMTSAMGGVLPEQANPAQFQRILDVGCGTGGWLIEMAKASPSIDTLIGVDISSTMLGQARHRAEMLQLSDRVEFLLMDALRMLEFPSDFFDLVNMRHGLSFLRTWDWPKLLQEFQRVTSVEGVVRITETTMEAKSNSSALTKLQHLMFQALRQAGHLFSEGMVAGVPQLMKQYGFEQVQTHIHQLEYTSSTREGRLCIEDITKIFRTALPFLHKWVQVPDDYDALYQQMLTEIKLADFVIQWPLVTTWGIVR